ncbi:MAG: putative sulfate/molybdate transporter [Proteobacteria bacterium]|nr:putative sulfate/molybdate transporter [Pseudomonadota bacterium]
MGTSRMKFDRMELAGSLGDLGTLIPLAVGMVMINGLSPTGLFLSVGLLYLLGGFYYGVPIAVQPMKVVAAYAVALALPAIQVTGSGLLLGVVLLILGLTGVVNRLSGLVPLAVVRGVQLSTGLLLLIRGVEFVAGTSGLQLAQGASEPWLILSSLPLFGLSIPMSLLFGAVFLAVTLWLLDNRRFPAGLVVVLGGLLAGALLTTGEGFETLFLGLHLPLILPFGLPTGADLGFVCIALVLPQLPMTLGNAVIANRDLSNQYFPLGKQRVTDRALCVSMGLANCFSFLVGGMPLCHGAGGLAAHYRFGARTAGSNVFIGTAFLLLALLLGEGGLVAVRLLPLGVLGVLLIFAGAQLALTIIDLKDRPGLFVAVVMAAIALASNLAWGFGVGLVLAWFIHWRKTAV